MKSKANFIAELFSNKKLTTSHKEKLLGLVVREMQFSERLEGKKENSNTNKRKLHLPKETISLLSLFNNSNGLKYLTHPFAAKKPSYLEFISICKMEFQNALKENPNIPQSLINTIENFAFYNNPKDEFTFKYSWASPEFVEWYKKNDIHPFNNAKWNKEMIQPFKNIIEVKIGNLGEIIETSIEKAFSKNRKMFNISLIRLGKAEFYTDVDSFSWALSKVFTMIREWSLKNFCFNVKIEYSNEQLNNGKFKILKITHIGSKCLKNSQDENFSKGDMKDIISRLWGLCNFDIIAFFNDGAYRKVILTDKKEKTKKVFPIESNLVEGFTYIFKFY